MGCFKELLRRNAGEWGVGAVAIADRVVHILTIGGYRRQRQVSYLDIGFQADAAILLIAVLDGVEIHLLAVRTDRCTGKGSRHIAGSRRYTDRLAAAIGIAAGEIPRQQ